MKRLKLMLISMVQIITAEHPKAINGDDSIFKMELQYDLTRKKVCI